MDGRTDRKSDIIEVGFPAKKTIELKIERKLLDEREKSRGNKRNDMRRIRRNRNRKNK